jgi:hypothetical protein
MMRLRNDLCLLGRKLLFGAWFVFGCVAFLFAPKDVRFTLRAAGPGWLLAVLCYLSASVSYRYSYVQIKDGSAEGRSCYGLLRRRIQLSDVDYFFKTGGKFSSTRFLLPGGQSESSDAVVIFSGWEILELSYSNSMRRRTIISLQIPFVQPNI